MKRRILLLAALVMLCAAGPAKAQNRFIVRSSIGSQVLNQLCLLQGCSVVQALDGTLNQVFLLTAPDIINPTILLNLLKATPGILDAELDQIIPLVGGQNQVTTRPSGLSDTTPVNYFGATVWDGYANQPAALIIRVADAHTTFQVAGSGIVADIDTGVDPTHPALQAVLLPGYDFTRNQPGGSEMTDFTQPPPSGNPAAAAQVNQSTAAVLDQSTAAVLDGKVQYAAFGHGTMVMGVIHLVAPQARLLPLKAFRADGSANLSDILRAIYYAVQNNANVINMSFDLTTNSQELSDALSYANQLNVICVASSGNDGQQEIVYPAAYASTVMGVASTNDLDQRSSFSNYGNAVVWVAAPGEAIITTYPFGTYAAGWGTSFSAPFVSGTAALFHNLEPTGNQNQAAAAVAHAQWVGNNMGNGRLDVYQTLQSVQPVSTADFTIAASPASQTIAAGESANFTTSVTPSGGFHQTVAWTCSGTPAQSMCLVSPNSIALDGSNNVNVTLTIQTTARPATGMLTIPFSTPINGKLAAACLVLVVVMFWIFILNRTSGHTRSWKFAAAGAVLVVSFCASCGGGSTVTPPPPPQSQGTPAGTYVLTVTGTAGNVQHNTKVNLTVN